jgi:hypothetical protein
LWVSCKCGHSAPSDRSYCEAAQLSGAVYVEARKLNKGFRVKRL